MRYREVVEMAFFSVSNGLSCETVKRQPKISLHGHFKTFENEKFSIVS